MLTPSVHNLPFCQLKLSRWSFNAILLTKCHNLDSPKLLQLPTVSYTWNVQWSKYEVLTYVLSLEYLPYLWWTQHFVSWNSDAPLPNIPPYPPQEYKFGRGTQYHTCTCTPTYPWPISMWVSIPMAITKPEIDDFLFHIDSASVVFCQWHHQWGWGGGGFGSTTGMLSQWSTAMASPQGAGGTSSYSRGRVPILLALHWWLEPMACQGSDKSWSIRLSLSSPYKFY